VVMRRVALGRTVVNQLKGFCVRQCYPHHFADAARQPADHLVVVLGDPAHAAAAAVTIDAAAVLHDPGGSQTTLSRALEPANLARGNEILNQADQRLMMKRWAALVV